jgi:Uma2 family endonuclease
VAEVKAAQQRMTAEEFLAMPDDGQLHELIDGEVVSMPPAGDDHCVRESVIMGYVAHWVYEHHLGVVHMSNAGFLIRRDPDTVRSPDGAFTQASRRANQPVRGYTDTVPDLVLEVVSPSDRKPQVLAKVGDWLEAGVKVVWLLWPDKRVLLVYRDIHQVTVLTAEDTLTCEDLLPGFALPLKRALDPAGDAA